MTKIDNAHPNKEDVKKKVFSSPLAGDVDVWLASSRVSLGQAVGVKEADDGIWLVSFKGYDLRYIDLEEKTLQPLENPFGAKSVTYVSGTFCCPCLRNGQLKEWLLR